MIDLLGLQLLTCFVKITKTIIEQFETTPKHEMMNEETIAIADIFLSPEWTLTICDKQLSTSSHVQKRLRFFTSFYCYMHKFSYTFFTLHSQPSLPCSVNGLIKIHHHLKLDSVIYHSSVRILRFSIWFPQFLKKM